MEPTSIHAFAIDLHQPTYQHIICRTEIIMSLTGTLYYLPLDVLCRNEEIQQEDQYEPTP